MNLFTRLALWWLTKEGAAIELRLVRTNKKRPGISGTRIGTYDTIHEGRAMFDQALLVEPDTRLTLTLRYMVAMKEVFSRAGLQSAMNEVATKRLDALVVDGLAGGIDIIESNENVRFGSNGYAKAATETTDSHVCDANGPLVWAADRYVASCDQCGKPAE